MCAGRLPRAVGRFLFKAERLPSGRLASWGSRMVGRAAWARRRCAALLASSKILGNTQKLHRARQPHFDAIDATPLLKDVPEDEFLQGEASRAAPE